MKGSEGSRVKFDGFGSLGFGVVRVGVEGFTV